jgi:hypothetical protein
MDASIDVAPADASALLQLVFVVALFVLAVGFILLVLLRLIQVREVPRGIRCLNCAGPLLPLLDASRRYHGEAACTRCGHLHEGVPWPRRKPAAPSADARAGPNRGSLD